MKTEVCEECHALVPAEVMELHEGWHELISSSLMNLHRLTRRTEDTR